MPAGTLTLVAPAKRHTRSRRGYRSKAKLTTDTRIRKVVTQMAEKKSHSVGVNNRSMVFGGASLNPVDFSDVPQGDTSNTREGDVIRPTSLRYGYVLHNNGTNPFICRVMIVQWFRLTDPVLGDILDDTSNTQFIVSAYKQHLKKSFTVLYDKTHSQHDNSDSQNIARSVILPKVKKISFEEGAQTGYGKLFMFAMSTTTGATHLIDYYGLLRYTDS